MEPTPQEGLEERIRGGLAGVHESTTEYKMKRKSIRQAERKYYNKQVMVNKDNSGSMWKTKLRALPSKPTRVLNTPKTQAHWRTNLIAFLFL